MCDFGWYLIFCVYSVCVLLWCLCFLFIECMISFFIVSVLLCLGNFFRMVFVVVMFLVYFFVLYVLMMVVNSVCL